MAPRLLSERRTPGQATRSCDPRCTQLPASSRPLQRSGRSCSRRCARWPRRSARGPGLPRLRGVPRGDQHLLHRGQRMGQRRRPPRPPPVGALPRSLRGLPPSRRFRRGGASRFPLAVRVTRVDSHLIRWTLCPVPGPCRRNAARQLKSVLLQAASRSSPPEHAAHAPNQEPSPGPGGPASLTRAPQGRSRPPGPWTTARSCWSGATSTTGKASPRRCSPKLSGCTRWPQLPRP